MAQRLKHLLAMRETWVQSLGQENPMEKEMATHSSILVHGHFLRLILSWELGIWR